MPQVPVKMPDGLKPYIAHGIDLEWGNNGNNALGECPFCKRDKFGVTIHARDKTEAGVFNCFHGGCESGSRDRFLNRLWQRSVEDTQENSLEEIRKERGLLYVETLKAWGVASSLVDAKRLLIPAYDLQGRFKQVYHKNGEGAAKPTWDYGHELFGTHLYDSDKDDIHLCEGPWDTMALWELLGRFKETGGGLRPTGNLGISLLASANVLGTPGVKVFFKHWCPLFAGKRVFIWYDNDHPGRDNAGREKKPAGLEGVKRVAGILRAAQRKPAEVSYCEWGVEGYNTDLTHGLDIRDFLRGMR